MTPEQEDAVRKALEHAPASVRAIAREAGVSQALLSMISQGRRSATVETVAAVAEALDRMAEQHTEAARILRDSLSQEENDE